MYAEGVLDIMDRYGPGKISLSKAKQIFRNENKGKINELRSEFINPNKNTFSELPSASRYSNRVVVDPETGQKFRSNGREWLPEEK